MYYRIICTFAATAVMNLQLYLLVCSVTIVPYVKLLPKAGVMLRKWQKSRETSFSMDLTTFVKGFVIFFPQDWIKDERDFGMEYTNFCLVNFKFCCEVHFLL